MVVKDTVYEMDEGILFGLKCPFTFANLSVELQNVILLRKGALKYYYGMSFFLILCRMIFLDLLKK